MAYNILVIRTAEFDDGAMYPVLGGDDVPIEIEDLDGGEIEEFRATQLQVQEIIDGKLKSVVRVADIEADVFITDARVAVSCTKYDKGGGWRGANLAVPVLNAVSHAKARHRRKGKMLVGHVRYPWMMQVGFHPKEGMFSQESLRLRVKDTTGPSPRLLVFDITPHKKNTVAELARTITERVARYRLDHDETMKEEEHQGFLNLVTPPRLDPEPKKFAFHTMPTFFNAQPSTAYPKQPN